MVFIVLDGIKKRKKVWQNCRTFSFSKLTGALGASEKAEIVVSDARSK